MRSDYKYRKPQDSIQRSTPLKSKRKVTRYVACCFIALVMVLYFYSNSKNSQVSASNLSASINRYRISNGYPTVSFTTNLNNRATKISKEIDKTGESNDTATIIFQSNTLANDSQTINSITAVDKNADALLTREYTSAGIGITNKTIVILLK